MTGGPLTGPASAYPTFKRPASICLSELNDVFVPGLIGFILVGCASAEPCMANSAAAMVRAAVPNSRRRFWLICSDILSLLNYIDRQRDRFIAMSRSTETRPADFCYVLVYTQEKQRA